MRLTAELILKSPNFLNPIKEREIDLRGNKIAVIENLGATQDQFDCIDFSDNEIIKVDGFPLLQRLRTLLLNNNLVARIANSLGESLPHLDTLILTNNRIINLSDIDSLAELPSLRRLSLLENMITKKQHYRLYIIYKLPQLKLLDFRKIKQKERLASEKLFGSQAKPKQSAVQAAVKLSENEQKTSSGLTSNDVQAITNAIKNASSMEEVAMLERSLAAGQIPKQNDTSKMDIEGH